MRLLDDRPGSAARNWMISGAFWMVVGVTVGLLAATEMATPEFLNGIPYLVFGRIRPVHTNSVWYGFLSMVLIGAGLHYTPQLCATHLWSEKLANLAMWIWNASQVAGIICMLIGYTSAHEYSEYPMPVDIMTMIALVILSYVTFRTISHRREPLVYVAIWYYQAALLWTLVEWAFLGGTGWRKGIYDALWTWFFGHNIFGLWITPLSLAACYYVVPREVRKPLFSHTLSLVGFWFLVTNYAPTGTHHLLQAPVPAWQKIVATVNSMLLLIPVYVFLTNIWVTMRGELGRIENSIALRYVFTGTVFYFIVSTQGSIQSLISVQRLTHFTQWVTGHAHTGLLGFAGFIAVGVLYDVLPQVVDRPLYSAKLANFQWWLMLIGQSGFMIVLTIAGLIQGSAWLNGEAVYRVIPELHVYMVTRAAVGTFVVVGAYIMLYNVWMTVRGKGARREALEPEVSLFDQESLSSDGAGLGTRPSKNGQPAR
ncbi:MAG TPA: cbb3-type cytochrome c oxidase subunit I [Armatimonadota bacterium]|nr:cbb3-type cytochrome c oxidase subunit I [Armatimonadota bacterium]